MLVSKIEKLSDSLLLFCVIWSLPKFVKQLLFPSFAQQMKEKGRGTIFEANPRSIRKFLNFNEDSNKKGNRLRQDFFFISSKSENLRSKNFFLIFGIHRRSQKLKIFGKSKDFKKTIDVLILLFV